MHTVTQTFEIIKIEQGKPPTNKGKIKFPKHIPNAEYFNSLSNTAKLNKHIVFFEQPITQYTSDSLMLLPKSRSEYEAQQSFFSLDETFNQPLYDMRMKNGRNQILARFNEERILKEFENTDTSKTEKNDQLKVQVKSQDDVEAFVNVVTNSRRKSSLAIRQRSAPSAYMPRRYTEITSKKILSYRIPTVALSFDGPEVKKGHFFTNSLRR